MKNFIGSCIYCGKSIKTDDSTLWGLDYMSRPYHISCFYRSPRIVIGDSTVNKKLIPFSLPTI